MSIFNNLRQLGNRLVSSPIPAMVDFRQLILFLGDFLIGFCRFWLLVAAFAITNPIGRTTSFNQGKTWTLCQRFIGEDGLRPIRKLDLGNDHASRSAS
jgi:hypothetical protein